MRTLRNEPVFLLVTWTVTDQNKGPGRLEVSFAGATGRRLPRCSPMPVAVAGSANHAICAPVSAASPRPSASGPDPDRTARILAKLGPVWRQVPDWSLAWLIANLVPAGLKVSDAEIEVELDRLLDLGPG
jgi:hypothetical protein